MSEWLDLMLEEIARKQRENKEARDELERRGEKAGEAPTAPPAQSK
ncbi:MAG: hypothetical protein GY949_07520 [Gammaproteobacteria bacterium]|nr:hypothetical protein [Gammaproteobacteria bacterium]